MAAIEVPRAKLGFMPVLESSQAHSKKSRASNLLALAFCALFFAGCPAQPTPDTPAKAMFVVPRDDWNREIRLPAPAARVIAIGPGAVEMMWALGAKAQLVGRDGYADFPVEAKKIAVAGDYQGPNIEQCVALRPDLVVVLGETYDKTRADQWQTQIGAPVAVLAPKNLGVLKRGIEKLAAWVGKPEKSGELTYNLRAQPQIIKRQPRAFIEIGRSPLWTTGNETLVGSVVRAAGFQNVAKIRGYQAFGIESLLALNPETYIVPSTSMRAVVLRQLRAHPALSKLSCVHKGHVIVVHPDLLLRPGPRLGHGILQLQRERAKME